MITTLANILVQVTGLAVLRTFLAYMIIFKEKNLILY
jgi:hypothetical protein